MPVAAALPYITAAASVAGVASSISAQRKAQSAAKDALAQQQQLAANLKYEPVNIENLKEQARQQAITNATQSLALERELSPDVAATRQMVAERVRSDLGLGGQLSPDVQAQVARAARVSGALSGAPAGPLTAAQIGLTAEGLRSQRLGQAEQFLTQNKLPVAGLDPGALASAIVAQNAAMNRFNLQKMGVDANLAESAGRVGAATAGSQQGINATMLNAIPSLLGQISNLPVFQPGGGTPNVGSGLSTPTLGMNAATPFAMPSIPGQVAPTETLFNYTVGSTPLGLPTQMPPTG